MNAPVERPSRRTLSEAEIRAIVNDAAQKAADEAVRQVLLTLGLSVDDPLEVQKDMQHIREWRLTTAAAKRHGIFVVIAVILSGLMGAVWMMLKTPS